MASLGVNPRKKTSLTLNLYNLFNTLFPVSIYSDIYALIGRGTFHGKLILGQSYFRKEWKSCLLCTDKGMVTDIKFKSKLLSYNFVHYMWWGNIEIVVPVLFLIWKFHFLSDCESHDIAVVLHAVMKQCCFTECRRFLHFQGPKYHCFWVCL